MVKYNMNIYNSEVIFLKVSYKPLWETLIGKGMSKMALREAAGISCCTLAKLGKNEPVKLDMLMKICEALHCSVENVVEFIDDTAF